VSEQPSRPEAKSILAVIVPLALVATIVIEAIEPQLAIIEYDDLREGQLEAAGAVVLTLIGGVLLGRNRRDRSRRNLLLATGFLVLAVASLFASIATPIVDSLSTSHFATWTTAIGGSLGALLLVGGAAMPERSVRRAEVARTLVGAALGLGAVALVTAVGGDALPDAFETLPTAAEELRPGMEHPALVIVELLTAAGCGAAAWRIAIRADTDRDELWRWMAVGLTLLAIAFLNYALFPSRFTELLYSGDLAFLIAIGVLLCGAILEITSTEAALVRWAVSSERTRVADELRAGVAQELAFMASQAQQFARGPEDGKPFDELVASVERAMEESRGAIAALVRPVDEPLATAVGDAAQDAAGRLGLRLELDLERDVDTGREARDGLVRLTREAVIVAARERGARTLSVELRGGRHVTLRLTDDGQRAAAASLAVQAMRERAEALGATFEIAPAAGAGTTVKVALP
jgi:signal transduction histidine kinase